jgi:predicted nucleotidyltransferase
MDRKNKGNATMDKNDAIRLSEKYLEKIRESNIQVLSAYLFGSYAKGDYHSESDIDLALVLPDYQCSFDTDVKLMALRRGQETMIETHTYSQNEFQSVSPILNQIRQYGIKI